MKQKPKVAELKERRFPVGTPTAWIYHKVIDVNTNKVYWRSGWVDFADHYLCFRDISGLLVSETEIIPTIDC